MTDTRTPAEVQQQIQEAFTSSPNNLTYTQTADEGKTTKMYLLKSKMYYDLQNYLYLGLALPTSRAAFEATYPHSTLSKLDTIDTQVYGQLEKSFVDMNNHCTAFEQNTMAKFSTVTGGIMAYCDHVSRYITGKNLVQDSINTMLIADTTSTDFAKAKNTVKAVMVILAKEAGQRAADCTSLVNDLTSFKSLCTVDAALIDYLNHQFFVGKPVYTAQDNLSPASNQDTYTKRLSEAIDKLRSEVNGLQGEISDKENERQHDIVVAGTAATYIWMGPCGLIAGATVMGVYGARAAELETKINNLKSQLAQDQAQADALNNTITMVQSLNSVVGDLDRTINAAITALTAMQASFAKQQTDLTDTVSQWNQISQGADGDQLDMVVTLQATLDTAISDWAELKILAADFMTNATVTYSAK